jgi:flagellar protein FliO/FliZ
MAVTAAIAAPVCARAADAPSPGPGLGNVLQVTLGLALVLAMVAGAAWLLRRLGVGPVRKSGPLQVVGGVPVGQRERVVLVEVRGTWLVLGVAPGQVRALHSMPRPEAADAEVPAADASNAFAAWLQRTMEKNRA